jgi:hypothetical protein
MIFGVAQATFFVVDVPRPLDIDNDDAVQRAPTSMPTSGMMPLGPSQ